MDKKKVVATCPTRRGGESRCGEELSLRDAGKREGRGKTRSLINRKI